MGLMYNGKRYIGVLELSSTAIKGLAGIPKNFKNNEDKLGRFKKTTKHFTLDSYIDTQQNLDLELYIKVVIPEVIRVLKWIYGFSPQGIKIVATGIYRNIHNSDEAIKKIESVLVERFKKDLKIELLTPSQESCYSYYSWIKTTSSTLDKDTIDEKFIFLNTGLNIDVGGGTTEISIVKHNDFENTVSIPIGADAICDDILNREYIDKIHFIGFVNQKEKEISKNVSDMLMNCFKTKHDIKYTICSGSNVIVEGGDEFNTRSPWKTNRLEWWIGEQWTFLLQTIYSYKLEKKEVPDNHRKYIMLFSGLVILKEIINHFEVDEFYVNYANLRIGIFYSLIDELKN